MLSPVSSKIRQVGDLLVRPRGPWLRQAKGWGGGSAS
jgi:hypothetical protein